MTPSLDFHTEAAIPDVVWVLTFGEIGAALYYSDMPSRGRHTAEQVIDWVIQGLQRAGGVAGVRAIDQELIRAMLNGRFDEVHDKWFPNGPRRQRAGDLADDLTRWLTGKSKPRPAEPRPPVRVPARPGVRPR